MEKSVKQLTGKTTRLFYDLGLSLMNDDWQAQGREKENDSSG
jgi:hypothetical protein